MRALISPAPPAARAAPPARQRTAHSTLRGHRPPAPQPPHRPTLHPPRVATPPFRPPRAVAAAATSPSDTPTVPSTREAAVAAAAAAIAAVLGDGQPAPAKPRAEPSRGKKKAKPKPAAPKGFATANAARCVVELPLAEDTPVTAAALAADLLASLPASLASTAVVAFGDVDAALAASDRVSQTVTVCGGDDDNSSTLPPGAWLLLVSPPTDDRAVRATLAAAKGHAVVCVNAPVDVLAAPPPSYGRGWAPAYVFQPIAIQGGLSSLLGASSSGAVLCVARGAGPSVPLWFILDAKNNLIGRSQRRPSPRDLEDAFYNAAAASSPLTKGAAALKGITDTLRGKK